MGEKLAGPAQPGRDGIRLAAGQRQRLARSGDRRHHGGNMIVCGGLVAGHLHQVRPGQVQVIAGGTGPLDGLCGSPGHDHPDGVEVSLVIGSKSGGLDRGGQTGRFPSRPARDRRQPVRAVVGGIHRGDDREQDLRRADVAGRLVSPDVLLAGLQREPISRMAVRVHGHPDQPAGKLALQVVTDADVTSVRSAVSHRHAESLRAADRDVGAELARRREQRKRERVGGDSGQRAAGARGGDGRAQVTDLPAGPGVLQQYSEQFALRLCLDQFGRHVAGHQLESERLRAGGEHREGLREAVGVGEEDPAAAGRAVGQRHGLGRGGRLVQHRCSGHGQRCQVLDHGLEVQQRFETSLGDLRLVWRVGGVPGRAFHDVPADYRRGDRAVVAEADHLGQHLVLRRQPAQLGERLVLVK